MSAAERKASDAALRDADDQERLILATGRYIGEGFDDPRLDALFLTMPISWKGTLAQYVGRLHRQHAGKTEVLVVDYVDDLVPILARMAAKRRSGYRALGYRVSDPPLASVGLLHQMVPGCRKYVYIFLTSAGRYQKATF